MRILLCLLVLLDILLGRERGCKEHGMHWCKFLYCRAQTDIMNWDRCQRIFVWAMTQHQKKLMQHHYNELFGLDCQEKYGKFDEEKIFGATSLITLDEYYSRRHAGFPSLQEYYVWASCKHHIPKVRDVFTVRGNNFEARRISTFFLVWIVIDFAHKFFPWGPLSCFPYIWDWIHKKALGKTFSRGWELLLL